MVSNYWHLARAVAHDVVLIDRQQAVLAMSNSCRVERCANHRHNLARGPHYNFYHQERWQHRWNYANGSTN